MKLAFSTNAYTRFSLHDALRGIKAAGYEGVEILADVPHAYPGALLKTDVEAIRAEIERLGLMVANVNANCSFGYWKDAPPEPYFEPSLISPNERHRRDRQSLILATLLFAHDIGAANISITSGRCLAGMPPERARKQLEESLKPVLDEAERLKINIGIECEPGLFIEYATELREWIDRLGSKRLGANLDIGHSHVLGESIPDAIHLLGNRIWNLHVEDIPGRKHYHLVPGEGSIPWPEVREALRAIHFDRFATVELYTHTADPQRAAEKSIAFLRGSFS